MKQLLIKPDKFFRERIDKPINLKYPFSLVLSVGILSAAYVLIFYPLHPYFIPGWVGGTIFGLNVLVFTIIFWFLGAIIYYLVSYGFKGKGRFIRTLELIGYTYLPAIFSSILTLLIDYFIPSSIPFSTSQSSSISFTSPSMLVSVPFILWGACLSVFAIKYARNLSTLNSIITVILSEIIITSLSLLWGGGLL